MKDLTREVLMKLLSPQALSYLFPGKLSYEVAFSGYADVVPPEPSFFDWEAQEESFPHLSMIQRSRRVAAEPASSRATPDPDALDPRTEAILRELERIQETYGVSLEDLEIIMGYSVTLSSLFITQDRRIYLRDFNNLEVRMDHISKALYFLYLRHPEGIRFKDVADHRQELLDLYDSVTGRDNRREIEKSIDHLVDPYGNALNVSASRIKIAFRNVVRDRVARFYYINGPAGEVKQVPLDRDLVIWC